LQFASVPGWRSGSGSSFQREGVFHWSVESGLQSLMEMAALALLLKGATSEPVLGIPPSGKKTGSQPGLARSKKRARIQQFYGEKSYACILSKVEKIIAG
jgi:hypothetical protein